MRTFLTASLLLLAGLAASAEPSLVLSGHARPEAKKPFTDYVVQVRDTNSNKVIATAPLDADAKFALVDVLAHGDVLVELIRMDDRQDATGAARQGKVVCTEGPYKTTKTDIVIACGRPSAYLLLAGAAAAGLAATAPTVIAPPVAPQVAPQAAAQVVSGAQ